MSSLTEKQLAYLASKGYTKGSYNERWAAYLAGGDPTDVSRQELWEHVAAQLGEHFQPFETLAELKAATPVAGTIAMAKDSPHLWAFENNAWVQSTADVKPPAESLGTVQQSILTEDQFDQAHGQTGVADNKKTWVLADGRDIQGSNLAQVTGISALPDLRGAYLRMAGTNEHIADDRGHKWDGGALGQAVQQLTAAPKNSFRGTTNEAGAHKHVLEMSAIHGLGQDTHLTQWAQVMAGYNKDESPVTGSQSYWSSTHDGAVHEEPNHHHTVTVGSGGDVETAPKTYTVNYFIKVN